MIKRLEQTVVFKEHVRSWFNRYFSDRQAIILAGLLLVGFGIIITLGGVLAPVLASLAVAYLLENLVAGLNRRLRLARMPAVWLVYLLFIGFLGVLAFVVLPLLWNQIGQFARELPSIVNDVRAALAQLPERYPSYFSQEQVDQITASAQHQIGQWGQGLLSYSLANLPGLITLLVYLILVPLLVFFFLKDKSQLMAWVSGYLPTERHLVDQVWSEMEVQIGNYVRGKVIEIMIVGVASFITFGLLGMKYAVMLSVLVGLSVIVPYVGATVVTIPVVLAAYFQFGWGAEFGWVVAAYAVIQMLDGNLLVPVLFSETVNIHPVAIVLAILVFGGIWGFWGVFFAIPLATLVKTVLNVWPGLRQEMGAATAESVPS
ncbi:MAG: AI-2E family transporter [Gammaproteobacteria bacterium]|nr:AI-2E family transporter [Gammaproteobacteria bacterium]